MTNKHNKIRRVHEKFENIAAQINQYDDDTTEHTRVKTQK